MSPDDNKKIEEVQQLVSRAYHYLSFRLRTEKEMNQFLTKTAERYGFLPDRIHLAIAQLREQGYIDDMKFVEAYVLSRQLSKQKSTFVLRNELSQKGIDRAILDEFFQENPQDEEELARVALTKKWYSLSRQNLHDRQKKAQNFLRQRGFSYRVIQKAIEELIMKE